MNCITGFTLTCIFIILEKGGTVTILKKGLAGTNVTISCEDEDYPDAKGYIWRQDTMLIHSEVPSLVVFAYDIYQRGVYQLMIKDKLGSIRQTDCSVELVIEAGVNIEGANATISDEEVRATCTVTGSRVTDITWHMADVFNQANAVIGNQTGTGTYRYGQTVAMKQTLTLPYTTVKQMQVFRKALSSLQCVALGVAAGKFSTVTSGVTIKYGPIWAGGTDKISATLGEQVYIHCAVVSEPTFDRSSITWTYNDGPLPAETLIQDGSVLINRVRKGHLGTYTCTVQDKQFHFYLTENSTAAAVKHGSSGGEMSGNWHISWKLGLVIGALAIMITLIIIITVILYRRHRAANKYRRATQVKVLPHPHQMLRQPSGIYEEIPYDTIYEMESNSVSRESSMHNADKSSKRGAAIPSYLSVMPDKANPPRYTAEPKPPGQLESPEYYLLPTNPSASDTRRLMMNRKRCTLPSEGSQDDEEYMLPSPTSATLPPLSQLSEDQESYMPMNGSIDDESKASTKRKSLGRLGRSKAIDNNENMQIETAEYANQDA